MAHHGHYFCADDDTRFVVLLWWHGGRKECHLDHVAVVYRYGPDICALAISILGLALRVGLEFYIAILIVRCRTSDRTHLLAGLTVFEIDLRWFLPN